jgi:succinyl-CoA synthetase alpha subunit
MPRHLLHPHTCESTFSPLLSGIAIGGDAFPGSTLSDHCLRYQHIPQVKMIVVLGEIGGEVLEIASPD